MVLKKKDGNYILFLIMIIILIIIVMVGIIGWLLSWYYDIIWGKNIFK
jgi:nitrate reductase NapE component